MRWGIEVMGHDGKGQRYLWFQLERKLKLECEAEEEGGGGVLYHTPCN